MCVVGFNWLTDLQTIIENKNKIYRKIKGQPDHDHIFYFQLLVKFPLFKSLRPFLDTYFDRPKDKHTDKKLSIEKLRAYTTLLLYFVSSYMLKSLYLRLFDSFWHFFDRPTDRQTDRPRHLVLEAPSPELKNTLRWEVYYMVAKNYTSFGRIIIIS